MSVTVRQLPAMVAVVPDVTPWRPIAGAAAAGLLLVATAGPDPGSVVFKLRLGGLAVAATSAGLLDDPAAMTLASSPTALLARRAVRVGVAVVAAAVWWLLGSTVAGGAVGPGQAPALVRELAVLTAVAILGAVVTQRWSSDGRGGGPGAIVATGWFALTFLPRLGALPLPPPPLDPASAGPMSAAVVIAVLLVVVLSRDPAAPRLGRRPAGDG